MTLTIGYQGEPGAFSEQAVHELLGDAEARGFTTFDDLVAAVDSGVVDHGLLPVENSILRHDCTIVRFAVATSECIDYRRNLVACRTEFDCGAGCAVDGYSRSSVASGGA